MGPSRQRQGGANHIRVWGGPPKSRGRGGEEDFKVDLWGGGFFKPTTFDLVGKVDFFEVGEKC